MSENPKVSFAPILDNWHSYQLLDGTVLRVKHVVTSIRRLTGQFTPDGSPSYQIESTTLVVADAPAFLMRDYVPPSAEVAEVKH